MSHPYMIKTVKCAHCGKARQEANRWFVVTSLDGRFRCRPLVARPSVAKADLQCQTPDWRLGKSEEPVCGQQCAQKLFERYLTGEMTHRPMGAL
jgi:hypothetical protein